MSELTFLEAILIIVIVILTLTQVAIIWEVNAIKNTIQTGFTKSFITTQGSSTG